MLKTAYQIGIELAIMEEGNRLEKVAIANPLPALLGGAKTVGKGIWGGIRSAGQTVTKTPELLSKAWKRLTPRQRRALILAGAGTTAAGAGGGLALGRLTAGEDEEGALGLAPQQLQALKLLGAGAAGAGLGAGGAALVNALRGEQEE